MNIKIITVANKKAFYFDYLKQSIKKNNGELIVLGFGQEWKGLIWKFKILNEYLYTLNEDDIICFIDGFDVICTRDLNELYNVYNNITKITKCKIIAAFDYIPSKIQSFLYKLYFQEDITKPCINSGTYIGKVKDIILMFQRMNIMSLSNYDDDQILFNKYYNYTDNIIYNDINAEIFCAIGASFEDIINYVDIKNNMVFYNNNRPFFIHAAGSGNLDNIIKKLGYKMDNDVFPLIKLNMTNKIIKTAKIYIYNIINKYKFNIIFFLILLFAVCSHL